MKLMNTIVFSLLLGFSSWVSAKTIEMDVNGLVCAFCAQGIQKTLKAFPAAEEVYVSLENRIVAVRLKDGSDIDDATLRKAIVDSGYTVVAIRRTDNSLDEIRKRTARHE